MERVVATYRFDAHEIDIVESAEDDGCWFHVVVDGLAHDELLTRAPNVAELKRFLGRPAQG